MKRSRKVELTAVMVTIAVSVAACDNVDDRTNNAINNKYNQPTQTFNYEAEKKLRVTCNKAEDFNEPQCHKPENQGSSGGARSGTSTSHSFVPILCLVIIPMRMVAGTAILVMVRPLDQLDLFRRLDLRLLATD